MKTKMKKVFYVEDWAGNKMNFGEFPSFEDAWGFIREKFPNEEDWQEYYVYEKKGVPLANMRDLDKIMGW